MLGLLLAAAIMPQQEADWEPWRVVGPFPAPVPQAALDEDYPPEGDVLARMQRGGDPNPRGSYRRDDGERVGWEEAGGSYPVNVARAVDASGPSVAYLYRAFEVDSLLDVPVEISAAGAYRVWLNGREVLTQREPVTLAGGVVEAQWKPQVGRNHLLVKLAGDPRAMAFGVRTSFRWEGEVAAMQGAIDQAIDRGIGYLLDRQLIDGTWGGHVNGYPSGITPVVLYTLLKCGLPPEHPAVARGLLAMRRLKIDRTYSAGFYLLALSAVGGEAHAARAEAVANWLVETLPPGKVYGYPGAPDMSNHVVAVLGLDAARRSFDLEYERDFWEDVLEGNLTLLATEQRVELPGGGTGYEQGFTYRFNEPSGSMTTAGITVCAIALRNDESLPSKLVRAAEDAMAKAMIWLANHWSVTTNPPNRSWHYFHLYGLERVGSLLGVDLIGVHPWYLEGARYLVDNQSPQGTWSQGGGDEALERDTCMALLFLKRATSIAVTKAGAAPVSKARSTAEDGDVVLRASGDVPMTIWVHDARVLPTAAEFFAQRVGSDAVQVLGPGEEIGGRMTIRHEFARAGRWEVWAELDTPAGRLVSPRLEVQVRSAATPELMAAATAAERNLILREEVDQWRSSSQANDQSGPAHAADGSYATGWSCANDDAAPWIFVEFDGSVKATHLRVTPNENRPAQLGAARPAKLRVIVNKRDVYELDVPADPWRKAVLDFGGDERIRELEIRITAMRDAVLGQVATGIAEIELSDED